MEPVVGGDCTCQMEEIAQLGTTKPPQPHDCLYGSKGQLLRPIVLKAVIYRKDSINLQSRTRFNFFFFGSFFPPALSYRSSHRFSFSEAALVWVGTWATGENRAHHFGSAGFPKESKMIFLRGIDTMEVGCEVEDGL